MPGTATFDGLGPVPVSRAAALIQVYRYTGYRFEAGHPSDPDAQADPGPATAKPKMTPLPNIRCTSVRTAVGADPGQATFRYVLDSTGAFNPGGWPTTPAEVFGYSAGGPFTVMPDDRLCVTATGDDGHEEILFDGFVQLPSTSYTSIDQDVSFTATGTPVRCWDFPLYRGVFRSQDRIEDRTDDRPADAIKIHFNPAGADGAARPNATTPGSDGETRFRSTVGNKPLAVRHAVFLDPEWCEDHKYGRFWSVSMAAKYILARGNNHQPYVLNPGVGDDGSFPEVLTDFAELDRLLDCWEPADGRTIDVKDATSYEARPIILRDLDVTSLPWPEALAKVIEPHGFCFCFRLALDSKGFPLWAIDFYRKDAGRDGAPGWLLLQPEGAALDPGLTNLAELNITRDAAKAFNEVAVEAVVSRHECDLVLAPLFSPAPADAGSLAAMKVFGGTDALHKTVTAKYREYGFDECGEGHWDFAANALSYKVASLVKVLGGPTQDAGGNPIADIDRERNYVKRRRKCSRTLLSRDETVAAGSPGGADDSPEEDEDDQGSVQDGKKGKPRRAALLLSWDYKGPSPGVWDGTGAWHLVKGWSLLDDRIGVRLTATNLEGWNTDNAAIAFGGINSAGVVKAVTSQAKAGATRFYLRLVSVIQGDDSADAVATRRASAPGRFPVRRYVDSDRHRYDLIHGTTYYNPGTADVAARDDRRAAMAEAVARRSAHEMPVLAGSATIPRVCLAYKVGMPILGVHGRGISFRMNGGGIGEGDRFPLVVGIEYRLGTEQKTILQVGDDRSSEFAA